jgi:hypothetical protein
VASLRMITFRAKPVRFAASSRRRLLADFDARQYSSRRSRKYWLRALASMTAVCRRA